MYLGDLRSPHSGVKESFLAVNAQVLPILSQIGMINLPVKIAAPIFPFLPSRNKPDFSRGEGGVI